MGSFFVFFLSSHLYNIYMPKNITIGPLSQGFMASVDLVGCLSNVKSVTATSQEDKNDPSTKCQQLYSLYIYTHISHSLYSVNIFAEILFLLPLIS